MAKFLIYGLIDPRDGTCRYVGKSSSGLVRPRRHGHPASLAGDRTHKGNWIRGLLASGLDYGIRVLECFSDNSALSEAEVRWIAFGRQEGWPLTNLTDGGDGLSNPSQETRDKIGSYSRARMADPEFRERVIGARRGKPLPEEWRRKIGLAAWGRQHSPEAIEKVAAQQRGRKRGPLTAEWKAKVGAGQRGKRKSADHRRKISEANRRYRLETCEKHEFDGKLMRLIDWAKEAGISINTIRKRLEYGWTIKDAIFRPVRMKAKRKATNDQSNLFQ